MAKSRGPIQDFESAQKRIQDYFQCSGDFFLKPLLELEWAIRTQEEFAFLAYWSEEGKKTEAVIVRKNGEPMVYKTKDYTMVVAIDCVKIGFIFRNGKEVTAV